MKITVVGVGAVGATVADNIARKELCQELVMLDIKEGMAEVYNLMNEPAKAKNIAYDILTYMKQFNGDNSNEMGQNEDHEMAHAYMGVGNYDKALEYALAEYKRRPANIEVNETVAIVYYRQGDYEKSLLYLERALKTNCKNPELLCHAGLIYAKAGKTKRPTRRRSMMR